MPEDTRRICRVADYMSTYAQPPEDSSQTRGQKDKIV